MRGDGVRGDGVRGKGEGYCQGWSGLAACSCGCTSTTHEVLAAAASRRGSEATSAASPKQQPAPRVTGCPGLRFEESSTCLGLGELLRARLKSEDAWRGLVERVRGEGER